LCFIVFQHAFSPGGEKGGVLEGTEKTRISGFPVGWKDLFVIHPSSRGKWKTKDF
jgi:hypothetical protein